MEQSKKNWSEAGLASFSPNSAPLINRADELGKMVHPTVYNNLVNLANGKYTLRDLTIKMKKDEISVSRLLLPYILKGVIKLVEVPDLPLKENKSKEHSEASNAKTAKVPLIACVDDSPQVCQMMEQILTSHGLRSITITDSTKALPILMQQKPDLIFLDLIMPVASGYEICTQLRRTSAFKNVPVVIISASEGLVDRVRAEAAKVMGATDFINKPILSHKILQMLDKHLYSQTEVYKQVTPTSSNVKVSMVATA
jgi:chemotaxis family two-component system response regulator PixG